MTVWVRLTESGPTLRTLETSHLHPHRHTRTPHTHTRTPHTHTHTRCRRRRITATDACTHCTQRGEDRAAHSALVQRDPRPAAPDWRGALRRAMRAVGSASELPSFSLRTAGDSVDFSAYFLPMEARALFLSVSIRFCQYVFTVNQ